MKFKKEFIEDSNKAKYEVYGTFQRDLKHLVTPSFESCLGQKRLEEERAKLFWKLLILVL